jgi:UDP-glucose 4-epimerase
MSNGKVLITGGCGFIGRHLCRKLVEMGKDVTVLDASVPRELHADGYKVVEGDIRDSGLIGMLMKKVDTVYHLGAVTTFEECRDYPNKALHVNAHGTKVVLREALQHGARSLVFFSSASVYSGSEEPVKHEEMKLNPKSIYGITKLMGEVLCRDIDVKHGLPCASLRLFNVYGERGRGVINVFARAIEKGGHITIHGDGSQTRDYIHVDDVVKAAIAIGERRLSGAYNVGTGGRCSLLELKGMMEQISGADFKVEWQPREPWDLQELIADTGKIKEILPTTIPLEEGLRALLIR